MESIPPLLLVVPLAGAALLRVPRLSASPRLSSTVAIAVPGLTAALALWLLPRVQTVPIVHWVGGWRFRDGLVVGIPLVADGVATGLVAFAAVLTAAVMVHASAAHLLRQAPFGVLTLLLLAAVSGIALVGDLFSMFVFIELLGISIYALTAVKVHDVGTVPAAFNLATVSTIGAVAFLTGVSLVYGATGTPNLAEAGLRIVAAPEALPASLTVGLGIMVAGLAIKAGLVPFHFAHADAHTAAMTPHAALFGAVAVPTALYAIARVVGVLAGPLAVGDVLRVGVMVLAVATALVGGVMALVQTHLKRLLAFSSVAHLGIAAVGVALGDVIATTGVVVYVVGHGLVKTALFLAVGLVLHRTGSVDTNELAGRGREATPAVLLLAIGGPLLAGAPPGGLHLGKVGMEVAAAELGFSWVMAPVYLGAVLTGAAVLRAVVQLWWGGGVGTDPYGRVAEGAPETELPPGRHPRAFVAVPVGLLLLGVVVPVVLAAGDATAGRSLADASGYAASVLEFDGEPSPAEAGILAAWGVQDLAKGLLAGGAAVLWGIAAVRGRPGTGSGYLEAPLRWVRVAHSGHLGDITMWATVGVASWCAWALLGT